MKVATFDGISIGVVLGTAFVFGAFLVFWTQDCLDMDDLGVLFNGLAFLVIFITLLTQNRTTATTLQHLQEQVDAQVRLAQVQKLSLLRDNTGSRIHYLRKLISEHDANGEKLPEIVRQERARELEIEELDEARARAKILALKTRLRNLENEIEQIKIEERG